MFTCKQFYINTTIDVLQIETGLETISTFILDTKTALEQVILLSSNAEKAEKAEKQKKSHVGDILGKKLRHVSLVNNVSPFSIT